jgi:hypothetical protein
MSRVNRTPTIGTNGSNRQSGSEQRGTACKKVPVNNRDSEGAFLEAEPCPGEDKSWIGAYDQSYMEKK